MTQASGPYDGRKARRKRCDRCVERRIKCIGGFPCLNCSKTNRTCHITTKRKTSAPIFLHATQATYTNTAHSHVNKTTVSLIPRAPSIKSDIYLTHFFISFLHQNSFTGIAPRFETSLCSLVHHAPELRDAINAISALHITQHSQLASTRDENLAALQAYSRSVHCVQAKIASKSFLCDPSALWTTLLLGVFELMRDSTGTNWLAHFLHGTSTILRMQGPNMLILPNKDTEQRQMFFFGARIFEIVRALIFTEPTFLAEPEWKLATKLYWIQHMGAWTPKEALFDILPQFVDLGTRTLHFVTNAQNMPQQVQHYSATSLAQEGLVLQSTLLHWHSDFTSWASLSVDGNKLDVEISIARVYYHTISVYLDGIFSYHVPFTSASAPPSPTLSSTVVGGHVRQILMTSGSLLDQGSAGILLFFPLRVAGARARDRSTRFEILQLLETITLRGFSVAQSFVNDLNELWARQ
ncbi:hypothetical protein BU25DRAFT_205072 [Macroventuria anomochaeta]|uniref:Uncharacterized protein n=1 Tax=Macroventuria anomochaeta TaxID=301207 RepID=A0ACB6RNP7_9PLEO|nr:uncharacterized protein BU25DRAFT_205072 [Macroventuria anomochaeta]KAF2622748.1 hypothetical protein BU25DRAFT_205072 [Macroventuria anomochaeta]